MIVRLGSTWSCVRKCLKQAAEKYVVDFFDE